MSGRPRTPLPCLSCGGLATVVIEVRADPDYRVGPTVWRRRRCLDCGHVDGSAEVHVSIAELGHRLVELATDRRALQRSGMVPASEMAGEHWAPGRGTQLV